MLHTEYYTKCDTESIIQRLGWLSNCFLLPIQASKDAERFRLEAVALREEKSTVEARADELAQENRTLRDRLSDGSLHNRTRERCVFSPLFLL